MNESDLPREVIAKINDSLAKQRARRIAVAIRNHEKSLQKRQPDPKKKYRDKMFRTKDGIHTLLKRLVDGEDAKKIAEELNCSRNYLMHHVTWIAFLRIEGFYDRYNGSVVPKKYIPYLSEAMNLPPSDYEQNIERGRE